MSPSEKKPQADVSHRARRVVRLYRTMLWLLPLPVSGCLLVGSNWLCRWAHWPPNYGIGAWLLLSFVAIIGTGLFDYQFHRLNPTLHTPLVHAFVFLVAQILILPILLCVLGMVVVGVAVGFSH